MYVVRMYKFESVCQLESNLMALCVRQVVHNFTKPLLDPNWNMLPLLVIMAQAGHP